MGGEANSPNSSQGMRLLTPRTARLVKLQSEISGRQAAEPRDLKLGTKRAAVGWWHALCTLPRVRPRLGGFVHA